VRAESSFIPPPCRAESTSGFAGISKGWYSWRERLTALAAAGLNWYRNIDRNWGFTAPWAGALIHQPALFIAGNLDPIIAQGSAAGSSHESALLRRYRYVAH
jgi:hypothetical protein